MRFAGAWGEDGYVRFPNNDPLAYRAGPAGLPSTTSGATR